jgi:hypothetical protein
VAEATRATRPHGAAAWDGCFGAGLSPARIFGRDKDGKLGTDQACAASETQFTTQGATSAGDRKRLIPKEFGGHP